MYDEYSVKFDTLKTKVLKYILYKKRTEQEIRNKFANEKEELLEDVIEYLKEARYIDDISYIQKTVNEITRSKTISIKEIEYKLYSKGIEKEKIEQYINEQKEQLEEYEKEAAKKIYEKKKNTMEIDNIIIFLKKKGFKDESIENLI